MKNPFASLQPAEAFAIRNWSELDCAPLPEIVERLERLGLIRVLHLKCEPEPINMLTTADFEMRDRLREERKAMEL